jgi:PAS domain S-box-containing protein
MSEKTREPVPKAVAYAWLPYLGLASAAAVAYLFLSGAVQNILYVLIGVSMVISILVGVRWHRPMPTWPWLIIAFGLSLFVAADTVFFIIYEILLGVSTPFPSVADALYLGSYAVTAVGLAFLVRSATGRDWGSLIDVGMVTTALSLVSWEVVIEPYAEDGSVPVFPTLVSLAYPVAGLLWFALAARLLFISTSRPLSFYLLLGGIALHPVTDAIYGVLTLRGTYASGTVLDLGWLLSYAFFGAAALHPSMSEMSASTSGERARIPWWRLALLAAAGFTPLTIFAIDAVRGDEADIVVGVGAFVLFALVIARMASLLRENERGAQEIRKLNVTLEQRVRERTTQLRTLVDDLEKSDARNRAVVETATDAIITMTKDGIIRSFNPAAERIFGYAAQEAIGQPLRMLMPERFREPHEHGFRRYLAGGEARVVGKGPVELAGLRKNGEEFPLELSIGEMREEIDILFTGIVRDITDRKHAEERIQANERRFRQLFEQSSDALLVHDDGGRIVDCNSEASRSLGYTREELLSLRIRDFATNLISKEQKASKKGATLWQRVMGGDASAATSAHIGEHRRKDGTRFPVEVRVSPIDCNGERMIFASARDITERVRIEREVHDANSLLATLIESLQAGVLVESEQRRILHVNEKFCEMFGIPAPPQTLVGKDCSKAAEESRDLFADPEQFVCGVENTLEEQRPVVGEELALGDGRTFERDYIPIFVNERYRGHLWQYRDVTERKNAETELRVAHQKLSSHIENSPVGILEWDEDTRILTWSREAEAMFGWSAEEVVGKPLGEIGLIHEEEAEKVNGVLNLLLSGEESRMVLENRNCRKDGSILHCEWYNSALLDESGELISVMSLAQDVTDRKQAEEELQRLNEELEDRVEKRTAELKESLARHERALGRERILKNASAALVAAPDRERIYAAALEAVLPFIEEAPGTRVSIWIGSSEKDVCVRAAGDQAAEIEGKETYIRDFPDWARVPLVEGRPIEIHPGDDPEVRRAFAFKTKLGAIFMVPLRVRGQFEGRIAVATDSSLLGDIKYALETLGSQVALALERADLIEDLLQRQSEERFRSLIQNSSDVIMICDENGTVTYVSPAVERVLGYSPEDFVGQRSISFVHPDDVARVRGFLADILSRPGASSSIELRIRHADGTWRQIDSHYNNSLDDPTVGGIVINARDVTERKKADEDRYRLAAIVESSSDAIIGKTLDGIITSWNGAAEKLYGYATGEVIGKSVAMLVPPDRPDEVRWILEKVRKGEKIERYDTVRLSKDGRYLDMEITVSPITDTKENIVGASTIARDVTERKKAQEELERAREAAEAANRAKSEFLANMSHEIRTPMNGVIGMTGLLTDTNLTEEQRDYAETIRRSGENLLTVINDILDFSKIEAGKLEMETINFALRNTVDETLGLFAERAHGKGLELTYLVTYDVPDALRGDPGRLTQILNNLLGNAIKFTDEGEVVLRVKVAEETEERARVRFEVRDTGIGMNAEQRSRLFQSFTQADASTTRRYGGTGLGLAISKQLVELANGEMGVESEPGVGSTFWFEIPFEKQPDRARHAPRAREDLEGMRVLVVDDNATNREIIHHHALLWGMRDATAEDARSALSVLRLAAEGEDPYDVVILDMHMPGMDGLELARAIKADSALKGTRLVLLASYGERGEARRAKEAGISAYLTKPVRPSQLYDTLATVMGRPEGVAQEEEMPIVTRHTIQEERSRSRARLLVAEDNAVNQKVAAKMLESLGYRVDVASNGLEAMEALARVPYEAILMDCHMPEMDGYEATREIRRREKTGHRIPIIALTASAMRKDKEFAAEAGMDDYVTKPVKREVMEETLAKWVSTEQAAPPLPESGEGPADTEAAGDPLDRAAIESLRELGGSEMLGELAELFDKDTRAGLVELKKAIEKGDASSVEVIAHKLKGSSGNMGAKRMFGICADLQNAGASGELSDAQELLQRLEAEFERVRPALAAEVEGKLQ